MPPSWRPLILSATPFAKPLMYTRTPYAAALCTSGDEASCRSALLRDVAGEGQHEPHPLVSSVGGGIEHERAPAVDHRHPVVAAVHRGGIAHAAAAEGPVHP